MDKLILGVSVGRMQLIGSQFSVSSSAVALQISAQKQPLCFHLQITEGIDLTTLFDTLVITCSQIFW